MRNLVAKLTDCRVDLSDYSISVNNGRTDGVYFYVNGSNVTVSSYCTELSEDFQRQELEWFLNGTHFEIN